MVVRPVMIHGLEMVALAKRQEAELEVVKMFIGSDQDGEDYK